MQDIIPVSVDDRRFTIWNWLGFLFFCTLSTLIFAGFTTISVILLWRNILAGDFARLDVFCSVCLTIFWVPISWLFYILSLSGLFEEPYVRGSVQIDPRSGRLILKVRHLTGLSRQKSLSFADVRDINVTWCESEDGKEFLQLALIPRGRPIHPAITNPADAANLPAFEARLRAAMVSAGWSDPRRLWMSTR